MGECYVDSRNPVARIVLKYLRNTWCCRFSPIVLGTGPKPSKGYSAFVLKEGRILVIKKGSPCNDSIWFLEVSNLLQ